jgi:hypothetical protein
VLNIIHYVDGVLYDLLILSYGTNLQLHVFCFILYLYAYIDAVSLADLSEKNYLETLPNSANLISLLGAFAKGTHRGECPHTPTHLRVLQLNIFCNM